MDTSLDIAAQRKVIHDQLDEIFRSNQLVWGKWYFPNHFRDRTPKFHVKILNESNNNRYLAVAAPRESAKSTILAFLRQAHNIAFKRKHFIVIIQNTFTKAAETLQNIKKEWQDNEKLRRDFPVEITRDSYGDSIFRHPDGFEIRVLCKGSEQMGSIRGEKFGAYRPDEILIDDLEDDEMVRNPQRRRELKETFNDALIPAGDRKLCNFIAVGTVLHDDSLISELVSRDHYKEWRKLFYTAKATNTITGIEESLWTEKWTLEWLNNFQADRPDTFAKEYMNDPVSGSLRKFNKSDFRRWRIENDEYLLFDEEARIVSRGTLRHCSAGIGVDLAWEEKKEADFTAIIPGFLTPNSELLVDTYVCEKGVRPDAFEEILFAMEARLSAVTGKPVPIGFEKGKLEKVFKWTMKQAMRRRNKYLWFKDIKWETDKISRIVLPLQPMYSQHAIYHRNGMGELEYQLIRIPSGTHDDLPDALQILRRIMEFAPKVPKSKEAIDDPGFEFLRNLILEKRAGKKPLGKFAFGMGKHPSLIPAKVTWWNGK